jgi:hypothetical protein
MSLEIRYVNLGEYPNDGSGDDLRTAFEKSNASFKSLEDNVVLSAINLGSGAPVWLDKVNNDLRFRSIKSPDENLTISYDSFEISLKVKDFLEFVEEDTAPKLGGNLDLNGFEINGLGDIDISGVVIADGFEGVLLGNVFGDVFGSLFGNVTGNVTGQVSDISNHKISDLHDVSSASAETGNSLVWDGEFWRPSTIVTKINAGENITITPVEGTGEVTISSPTPVSSLDELTDVVIANPTQGQILQYSGTTWNNVNLNIDGIFTDNYDFGLLSGVRSPFDLLFQFTNVDFGSINNPSSVNYDLGFIEDVIVPPPPPPPPPTYSLSSNLLSAFEGSSVTITLTTTNLINGSVVPYLISGVSSNDINGTSLSGSFVIFNNTASLTVPITLDLVEENETLTLTLVGITPVVSISIEIIDFEIPLIVDNGFPDTEDFDYTIDGGSPSDTPDIIINGGTIESEGLTDSTLGGGSPFDTPTVIADGEGVTDPVSVVLDGGELI